jgi:hypothetical protein
MIIRKGASHKPGYMVSTWRWRQRVMHTHWYSPSRQDGITTWRVTALKTSKLTWVYICAICPSCIDAFRYPQAERRTELREHLWKEEFGNAYVSYNDTERLCPPSDATNHGMTGRLNLFKLPFFCQLCPLSHRWSIVRGKEWINQMHLVYRQERTAVISLRFC